MKSFWEVVGLALTIVLIYALCFGVTYRGSHYALSCSCDKGVEVTP